MLSAMGGEFLTTGEIVADFECGFSEFVGMKHTVGLNSCTAALHLALLACGVGPGDEVITTPMTFVATSLAIIHCGAVPVWVDVEPETGNMDADKIEAAITIRTKAILPVHLYGQMCDMRKIRKIANSHALFVIEDAAHSLISERDGIRVGQLGDAVCFSFYATKSITCGEGGALCTNKAGIVEFARRNRSHGLTSDASTRCQGKYVHWDMPEFGWKYNMDNLKASMLIPQLDKAERQRKIRKDICEQYRARLGGNKYISYPMVREEDSENKSDYHLFTIWVDKRDDLLRYLQEREVGVAVNYRSINKLLAFANDSLYKACGLYESEKIGDKTLSLPTHCKLSTYQVDYVCDSIDAFFRLV